MATQCGAVVGAAAASTMARRMGQAISSSNSTRLTKSSLNNNGMLFCIAGRGGHPLSSLGLHSGSIVPSFVGRIMTEQKRGIADEKAVKNRMRSVRSIQKITKAMKMVAASKLRSDQKRRDAGLPFALPVMTLFDRLTSHGAAAGGTTDPNDLSSSASPSTKSGGAADRSGLSDVMMVCLSSDKGLCGGVNSAVAKLARLTINQEIGSGSQVTIYGVGDKIRAMLQLRYPDQFQRLFNEVTKAPINFGVACLIAERLLKANSPRLTVLHNQFKSVIAYDTKQRQLITQEQAKHMRKTEFDKFEFEPETSEMWNDLYEFYVGATVFHCMLEGTAAEQSARMSAMDNASKNAGEMLSSLTLAYNKARQLKITMELIEIISGANAL